MIAVDTETTGIDLRHASRPFFVSICHEDGNQLYWEWDVDPLTRIPLVPKTDVDEITKALRGQETVFHNPKFDVVALGHVYKPLEDEWDWTNTKDTLMAGHLLNSSAPHDLTTMALVYLKTNIKPYEDRLKVAVQEARRLAKAEFPEWKIATPGMDGMPSCKDSAWGSDMWLPRAVAKAKWEASESRRVYEEQGMDGEPCPEQWAEGLSGWEWRPPETLNDDDAGHPWWAVLAEYSNMDTAVTLPLYKCLHEIMKERGLLAIYEERLKVLPVVHKMESRGITLSSVRLNELRQEYLEESERAGKVCVSIAKSVGYELVLPKSGNNNSLKYFCFGRPEDDGSKTQFLNLPVVVKTDKGEPSLDKTAMEEYADILPANGKASAFVRNLRAKRKRDTALAYMEGYERFWQKWISTDVDPATEAGWYVLHPSLNPTGTSTLRFSSSNPNEQNISKQEGFNLRHCFGPAPGREWWSLDYENIELRIPAYESGESVMIEIFEKPDEAPYFGSYHLLNASIVYPDLFWPLAEQKGEFKSRYNSTWYKRCKGGGFAIQYGCQEKKADATFGRPGSFKAIKEKMPKITALNDNMVDMAQKCGYVETMPDRTVDPSRGYPVYCSRTKWGKILPTVPLNYHIQSTAMWCMMKAMKRVQEFFDTLTNHFIVMQVHDELVLDLPKGGKKNMPTIRKVKRLMEESGNDIGVPLKVSVSYHPETWAEEVETNKA